MKRWVTCFAVLLAVVGLYVSGCETMYADPEVGGDGVGDFVVSGNTESFFTARQVDPRSEDSAGPQLVQAADFNGDGMMDLASVWNQSQPVQVHIQQRDGNGKVFFLTVPIGGTTPIAEASGLRLADMDLDGRTDIVVLIKDTGTVAVCDVEREDCDVTDNGGVIDNALWGGIVILYNPPNAIEDIWEPTILTNSFFAGTLGNIPEEGGYTDIDVGQVDGKFGPDIVVAFNSAEGDPPVNRFDLYLNPGNAGSRRDDAWDNTTVFGDLPDAGAVAILDVDRDGDNDIVASAPNARSANVFWLPNPLIRDGVTDEHAVGNPEDWNIRAPLGHVDSGANRLAIADVDGDGFQDVAIRSTSGQVVQWFRAPEIPSTTFVRNPWRVYTLAEFLDRDPHGMAFGDLNGDDQVEAVISAEGAVVWFDPLDADTVYDHWGENLIIDEGPAPDPTGATAGTSGVSTNGAQAPAVTDPTTDPTTTSLEELGTFINTLLIVDIDGDGMNDIVGTIDRGDLSGLADDALVWFENRRN